MATRTSDNVMDEIFADDLSNCSDGSDSEDVNDSDDESEFSDSPIDHREALQSISSDSEAEANNNDVAEENDASWTEIDNPPLLEPFLGKPGVQISPSNQNSVSEIVDLFIGDDIFTYMMQESNRYHHQNSHKFKNSRKAAKWRDITLSEMKKFLGLIIIMGHIRRDSLDEYWTTDEVFRTPFFSQAMTRDRFCHIWKSWHFSNNEQIASNSSRLYKIQPIVDYFAAKFKTIYKPMRELSLDESIIPWKRRLSFHVHNAGRLLKNGILIRMIRESYSGYICNIEICMTENKMVPTTITSLLAPYKNLWHHLYMDNLYSSVTTSETLLAYKIRSCGIISVNRGVPEAFKKLKMKRGESCFRRKKDVLVQTWKSKKEIRMISTIHSTQCVDTSRVDRTTGKSIKKPSCIVDYKKYMKRTDHADQYLLYYSVLWKSKKWTKRAVLYLINCALFNAYRVYYVLNPRKIKYKVFLQSIARHWVTDHFPESNAQEITSKIAPTKRTPKADHPLRLSMDFRKHKVQKIVTGGKSKHPSRICRVCAARKKRSETRYICAFCGIALHRGTCFERYHTLQNY